VVGYQQTTATGRRGARWVDGREELFQGPIGPVGIAVAANFDGSIVTGAQCRFGDPVDQSAWMWTGDGGVQCLAAPGRRQSTVAIVTRAAATSDDGRIIGGGQTEGSATERSEAVIWVDRAPAYLKDFLRANGAAATLMSGSGSTTFAITQDLDSATELSQKFKQKFGPNNWITVVPATA